MDQRQYRIAYIEDSKDVRANLVPSFTNGFVCDDEELKVTLEERADFDQLEKELESGKLADVYILIMRLPEEVVLRGRKWHNVSTTRQLNLEKKY